MASKITTSFHYHIIEGIELQDITDDHFIGAICYKELKSAIKYIKHQLQNHKPTIARNPIVDFALYKKTNDLIKMLDNPNPRQVATIAASGLSMDLGYDFHLILAACQENCDFSINPTY